MRTKWHWLLLMLVAGVLALAAAGCGGDDDDDEAGGGTTAAEETDGGEASGGTLVFASSADPVVLDGALVSDGESLRAIDQMFEGLVTLSLGGTEIEPALATEWEASEDGLQWTFQLREGVTFHDGEPFNAEAVCFNFDRWYNFSGPLQNPSASYYWQTVFGGFAEPEEGSPETSLYESCEATSEFEVVLNLTKASTSFLGALALTNFTIASPAALEEFGADEGTVDEETGFRPTGTYGTEHPVGTGPFKFESWTRGDRLVMVKNEDYWGEPAKIDELIFRPISDNAARLQALQAGEIQGYDLVEPQDIPTIEGDENLQILDRPAFNVGYVGINQATAPLELTFCYPTDVSRPYMPDPPRNFEAFAASMNAAGFKITPRAAPWSPDYLGLVDEGNCPLYLLGWTGDYADPDNFIGTFFQSPQPAWGFENQELFDKLDEAEAETDEDARIALYQEAYQLIADFVPGVPYVHTEPALAFAACVQGYEPSPVSLEPFSIVSLEDC